MTRFPRTFNTNKPCYKAMNNEIDRDFRAADA